MQEIIDSESPESKADRPDESLIPYSSPHHGMFDDSRVRGLSDAGFRVWLYLASGPRVNTLPGFRRIAADVIAGVLRITAQAALDAMADVSASGLAYYHAPKRMLWVRTKPVTSR